MIREGVVKRLKEYLQVEDMPLNVPPKREMGDFSSAICLSLAKQRKKPPMEIAKEVIQSLESNLPPFIREITLTPPGYLNFKVNWPALAQHLIPRSMERGDLFGKPLDARKGKGLCRTHERQSQQGHAYRPSPEFGFGRYRRQGLSMARF